MVLVDYRNATLSTMHSNHLLSLAHMEVPKIER